MRKRCDGEAAIVDNRLLSCSDKVTPRVILYLKIFPFCHRLPHDHVDRKDRNIIQHEHTHKRLHEK